MFARREAEGMAKGKADAVLLLLATRGIEVSDEHRNRIASCTDTGQLDDRIARAVTATTVADLFD